MKQNLTIRFKRPTSLLLVVTVAAWFTWRPGSTALPRQGLAPQTLTAVPSISGSAIGTSLVPVQGPPLRAPLRLFSTNASLSKAGTEDAATSEKTGSAIMRTIRVGTGCSLTTRAACTSSSMAKSGRALLSFPGPARERTARPLSIEFGSFASARTKWSRFGRSPLTRARLGQRSSAENTRERNRKNG